MQTDLWRWQKKVSRFALILKILTYFNSCLCIISAGEIDGGSVEGKDQTGGHFM